jgi:N-acetylglucosamine-6-phosphate deacetylase
MSSDLHAIVADRLFDGEELRNDFAVLIKGQCIHAIVPRAEMPLSVPVHCRPYGMWLAPGFVDVQVNGGGDVLFNDEPTSATIARIAAAHLRYGVTALLPTLISDSREKMIAAIDAAEEAVQRCPNVLGIHLEGPFLSPLKSGVHDTKWFRTPDDRDLEILTRHRKGTMLVTVAPEMVPSGFIAQLVSAGVTVSLGHSNATYAQAKERSPRGRQRSHISLTPCDRLLPAIPA